MSAQEKRRRRTEKRNEEKKRKKEESKKKKKEATGGMKEEGPEEIEEVKAEMAEVAVEDIVGGGDLVLTPWLRGEEGHAWGLSHAN